MSLRDLKLQQAIRLKYKIANAESKQSLRKYLDHVVIESLPIAKRFGDVREKWQDEIFNPLIPAIENMAGFNRNKTEYSGPNSFWYTLPKGHDKTSGEARLLNWVLAYGKRKSGLNLYAAAADKEQAGLILDSMSKEALLNPWLKKRIKYNRTDAIGPGGKLTVLAADAATNAGLRPDFIICDELGVWKNRELYTALVAGCAKRPGSILVVITNAGMKGSWQWDCLQEAKNDKFWHVYESPQYKQLASWMSKERVDSLRKALPPGEAARLYDNRWVDPGEEDGYVLRHEVEQCEQFGTELNLKYQIDGDRKISYYTAIDYGAVKDRAASCTVHYDRKLDTVIVDRLDVIQGTHENRVKVKEIEGWIEDLGTKFHHPLFSMDQYQMEGTIQKYEDKYRIERFEYRGGKQNYKMAELLRSLIINKKIAWYKGCGRITVAGQPHDLSDELIELIIRRMSYGYRFDHESCKHDDRAVVLGMAVQICIRDSTMEFIKPVQNLTERFEPKPNPIEQLRKQNVPAKLNIFGMEKLK